MSAPSLLERLWYPGPEQGPGLRLLRAPLHLAALGFGAAVAARNALYDRGTFASCRVAGARVLSVGNLNVGGAGKTQVVLWLVEALAARGEQVAVLSRGYGRSSRQVLGFGGADRQLPEVALAGDEPLLIAGRCPAARVWVGADRCLLAAKAAEEGARVLVLDDGMQHRRLARDEELTVVDEAVGLGNGCLLPAGPLREPPAALRRATLLWLRAGGPPRALGPPGIPTVRALHAPCAVVAPDGQLQPVEALLGQRVWLLCALARPSAFARTVLGMGAQVQGQTVRPDHHLWTQAELGAALEAAGRLGCIVVTTEKDRVKLPPQAEVWVVRLGVQVLEGHQHLERLLCGGAPALGEAAQKG